jgi:NodT family efflux transporter outer membrane factor (OMF) lipoprotein
MQTRRALVVGLLLSVALGGCRLGPEPGERPNTAADLAASYVSVESTPETLAIGRWWEKLGDPEIQGLVEQALQANPDLRAAAARVLAADASRRAAHGARFPQANLSANASRSKNSISLPQLGRVSVYSTTYSADLGISYAVDLFGRLARTEQAAWAELLAAEDSRLTVWHSLVAAVVRSRVAMATLEWRLENARATEASWRESLGLVERRYRSGLLDPLDVALTRQSLAVSEAVVFGLQMALRQNRHAMDVLLGRQPGTGEKIPATLPDLPGAQLPPAGLPAELLERRPDLRVAEQQLAAATARVGVAMADLFPSLTLTGSAGSRSDGVSDLLSSETLVYNAVAGLLAPIFSAGRLRAQVDVSEARMEEAAERYASAVLVALREVEDALVREEGLRETIEALGTAAVESRIGAEIALARYERGTAGLLTRLESQRRRFASEDALLVARGDLWNARIDLHLALGGDWQESENEIKNESLPMAEATETSR